MLAQPSGRKYNHPFARHRVFAPWAQGNTSAQVAATGDGPRHASKRWGSVRMSDGQPSQVDGLEIRLPANADQIPVARRAVADFCELYGLPAPLVDDVKLVVTEACTNVVLHAYEGVERTRMFEVRARVEPGALLLSVSDQGRGIGAPSVNRGLGLGLRLALQLAGGVQTREGAGGLGTRLTMRFAVPD